MFRVVLLALAALSVGACGPKTTGVKQGGGGGQVGGMGSGSAQKPPTGTGPVGTVPDVGCLAPSCAYHAGANAYFTCLSGGAGSCFHFGAPCTPTGGCMYDATDRTYKQCAKPSEGACLQWGGACAPPACMFSAQDGLHHKCDEIAGGGCKKYGALCAP